MSKTVLVTGANGFTGSNLCRRLVEQGYRVRALVRPSGNCIALRGLDVEIVRGDLALEDGIPAGAMDAVETVYHIAALYRHEGGQRDQFLNVNVLGTERLLQAALRGNVARFVHCSTGGVHGHIANPPADENAPFNPGDWYQETKLEGEKRVLAFSRAYGLPVSVIRPSPIYGAGDTRFLKLFRAINNGAFRMIGDGTALYHFVYIDDLVRGFLLAGELDAAIGETFIIAGPEYLPVSGIVELIARELGKPDPRGRIPVWPVMAAARACKALCRPLGIEPPLYPRRLDFFLKDRAFDCTRAREMLRYEPAIGLAEGIAKTRAWYHENNLL